MSKYALTLNFATQEELIDFANTLSGANSNTLAGVPNCSNPAPAVAADKPKVSKAAEKKAVTKAATEAPMKAPKKPSAKAVTLEELKAHILNFVDQSEGDKIKEFVRTSGAGKFSELDDAQRADLYARAEEYFGGGSEAAAEDDEDPMA